MGRRSSPFRAEADDLEALDPRCSILAEHDRTAVEGGREGVRPPDRLCDRNRTVKVRYPHDSLWAVTFGVASRVWPSRVRIGSRAAVTRSRKQLAMAASMCPVKSHSPGEGWRPPLTAPPVPASGVLGAVVLPGPTW